MNFNDIIKTIKNKKTALIFISLIMVSSFICIKNFTFTKDKHLKINQSTVLQGYKVILNNKVIGIVEDRTVVDVILSDMQNQFANSTGLEILIDKDSLDFQKTELENLAFTHLSLLKNKIKNNLEPVAKCTAINIDGTDVIYVKSESEAEEIIEKIKSKYLPNVDNNETIDIQEIRILENIDTKTVYVNPEYIMDINNAIKYLLQGTTEEKIYEVKKGDSLWIIAKNNNMTVEEIIQANPEVNPALIHIGDKINLIVPKPYLNVMVKYLHTYNQNIPYNTIVKKDLNLERNKWIVERNGKIGQKEVTAEIVLKTGLVESRKIINEKIITEPETRIVVQGGKRLPEDNLLSAFLPDSIGVLTSRFGMRWGRPHNGIDAGVPVGTPVLAYMAGTVSFSGWKSGYGYLVIIDHENGYETYYGHNSKLLVKAGDKVTKKQTIAYSGNTGRSTGPHVHFEVHKNGIPIDPLKFLKNNK